MYYHFNILAPILFIEQTVQVERDDTCQKRGLCGDYQIVLLVPCWRRERGGGGGLTFFFTKFSVMVINIYRHKILEQNSEGFFF